MRTGYLAIDLGPTRLAAGVLDAAGDVMVRDRVATPARNVWPAVTRLVSRVLAANPSDVEPRSVGVTCPGPIDRMTGAMKPVGMPMWHDFPLRRELAAATDLPTAIDTAGRALALAELWRGETASRPPDRQHVATLVLGDDVDGALVTAGRLVDGLTGNLGQFGHLIVEPEGLECRCGALGCLNAYAGALAIEAGTGRELRRTPDAIVERTGIMTARACAAIAAMTDPTDIAIGGIVPSVLGARFFDALDREFEHRCGLDHLDRLRVRGIGDTIGPLLAAAAVARHADIERAADDAVAGERRAPAQTRIPPAGIAPTQRAAEAVAGPRVRVAPVASPSTAESSPPSPSPPPPPPPPESSPSSSSPSSRPSSPPPSAPPREPVVEPTPTGGLDALESFAELDDQGFSDAGVRIRRRPPSADPPADD